MSQRLSLATCFLLLGSLGSETGCAAAGTDRGPGPAFSGRVKAAFLQAPLSFEQNLGQADPKVSYLARVGGYTLFLTPGEAVLVFGQDQSLGQGRGQRQPPSQGPAKRDAGAATNLRMKLIGANSAPMLEGLDLLRGKSHYFNGNDPRKWRTDVPHYGKVRSRDVYSGIDLIYYGNHRRLEFDFIVSPGINPKNIKLAFDGVDTLELDAGGDLLLRTTGGELRLHKPVVYQETAGTRHEIVAEYVLHGKHQVGVQVAAFDTSKPLIIDPVLSYSTFLGGSDWDVGGSDTSQNIFGGNGIAVDGAGNVYITGWTLSPDFPGALQSNVPGDVDAFVTKLNATGSAVLYSMYLGGSDRDWGTGIAVDGAGHAYVTGLTLSTDFPTSPRRFPCRLLGFQCPFQRTSAGRGDIFVTKLSAGGSALLYSTYLGGTDDEIGGDIAVDDAGNAYVIGTTASSDFPISCVPASPSGGFPPGPAGCFPVTIQPEHRGGYYDAFVTKLNRRGTALHYSTYLGGSGWDSGKGIAVDPSGNAYVTGQTRSFDDPATPLNEGFPLVSPLQPVSGGGDLGDDAFVAKLNPAGSTLLYSTYLGGSGDDSGEGIAIRSVTVTKAVSPIVVTEAYVTGSTTSVDFPLMRPFQANFGGRRDAFVTRLNSDGSALAYSTYLGGAGPQPDDAGRAIAVDTAGNAYVTGSTLSTNFPTIRSLQGIAASCPGYCEGDVFVAKLDPTGFPLYVTYLGGTNADRGNGIAVDGSGNAYVTGGTLSGDFPLVNPYDPQNDGGSDAFIAKLADPATGTADLAIIKSVSSPDPVAEGTDLTYTLSVVNNGPAAATGVTLIEMLAPEVTYVSASPSQGNCAEALSKRVICNLGNLNVGLSASATVTIVVTPNKFAP